jgi:hypothetical protein
MPAVTREWLADFSWQVVTEINAQLCEARQALHKSTSDGYREACDLWTSQYRKALSIPEAVDLCRRCHRLAPFCFFNGNTFVAIMGVALQNLRGLSPAESYIFRNIAGHLVAGTNTAEEERQFQELLLKLN